MSPRVTPQCTATIEALIESLALVILGEADQASLTLGFLETSLRTFADDIIKASTP